METINIAALPISAGTKVLDVGCGEGRHTHAVCWHFPKAFALGVDLNLTDLTRAASKGCAFFDALKRPNTCTYSLADGTHLPFASASFDVVICSEVLEHVPNYMAMLAEIERILKPSGTLALSVPRAWPERICWWLSHEYHQVPGGHLRIFNAKRLEAQVAALGFNLQQHYFAHALHSPYWWLRCLLWRHGPNTWLCRTYHRVLVWDLLQKPWITQRLERLLNPIMGKSIVWCFTKNTFKDTPCTPP